MHMVLSWFTLTLIATICAGIFPLFFNKAIQTHGAFMNLVATNLVFTTFSIFWLATHSQDLSLITKRSLLLVSIGALINLIGGLCLFSAFKQNPIGLSVIVITLSFSVVIVAVLNHLLGNKLRPHQWIGALIAFLGIALVNWKR